MRKNVGKKECRQISPEAMRLRLAGLCARCEQCEYDLRLKIFKAGLSAEEADNIISFLHSNRYLDERRYADAYCSDKIRFAGWGIRKIRQGLMAKRLPADIIADAIGNINRQEYLNALKRVGIAKARTLNLMEPDQKAKFFRHLASRGFEMELISRLADAIVAKLRESR